MFVVYKQVWDNGRVSYHRSPMDIGEFAKNHTPEPARVGDYMEIRKADSTAIKQLEGKLGVWG